VHCLEALFVHVLCVHDLLLIEEFPVKVGKCFFLDESRPQTTLTALGTHQAHLQEIPGMVVNISLCVWIYLQSSTCEVLLC
jgi:hypothetical protein